MNTITLWELNHLIHNVIEDNLDDAYWVTGELSEGRQAANGHFYGELIQKDDQAQTIVARARVNCWARIYNLLRLRFLQETGQELRAGLKVKVLVSVTFHEQYGYALSIQDIDSAFTLGDLAKRRREILAQLEADGILHDNQQLPLPRLLRRIAIVSSQTAAGYGDFCNQLASNEFGLSFVTRLFPAIMQGRNVEESVIAALEQIAGQAGEWDVVVIIRGGGATGDLSDFDSYPLASCIAQFPIPVITGIGHERDETVLDFVAHTRVKTPTAAAAFLIDHQAQEAAHLDDLQQRINRLAQNRIVLERQRLERFSLTIPLMFDRFRQRAEHRLDMTWQQLTAACQQRTERERHRLEIMAQRLEGLDPALLLRRGYSITRCGGRIVRCADDLREGEELETQLENGTIKSIVVK
ncbi:MAG: exodeoxyribonuclease VII large subunit [Bacteroidaceae bacterium]|nr:exodeoxyribonuclease VII large subunit [Bacteroidaceae bacterium]